MTRRSNIFANIARRLNGREWLSSFVFLLLLIVVFGISSARFLSVSNSQNVLSAIAVIGLLSLGATFAIGIGGIDLSAGSVMALSATLAALSAKELALPPVPVFLLSACVGASCGLLSGVLIHVTRAPSFIVTLGMLSASRASAYIVSDATPVYGLPKEVLAFGQGRALAIPGPIWFLLVGLLFAWILLRFTKFGLHLLMIGDNPTSAAAMGVDLSLERSKAFALAGLYSGVAGFVFMARTNSGDPTAGQGYELTAITAVILGGASLFGGRASAVGTFSGALCLGVLQNGLNLLAVGTYYQVLFIGLVLIAAAFISGLGERR